MTQVVGLRNTTVPASMPVRPWRRRTALLVLGALSLNGCYSTLPVAGVPAAATRLVLDVNDRGRVAYGDRIGSSVRQVEGIVESATDSAYVLQISSVRYLDGRHDTWSGERFTFTREHVAGVRQRRFSRGRTTVLGIVLGAALTAVVLSVDLIGGNSGGSPGDDPSGGNQ